MSTWATVLTSAATGALVVAIAQVVGKIIEGGSRKRELLLNKSVELALARTEFVKEIAFKSNTPAQFHDSAFIAASYYAALKYLLKTDKLPPQILKKRWQEIKETVRDQFEE
ncbi:MAG TPA: hypothetical protein VM425_07670 [Myxococcota bacterium]|nr:hypothetical protein [Myxococcota bacterium]